MTASTSKKDVGDLPEYNDVALPLRKHMTVRVSLPMYARIVTRALVERQSEGAILRRLLWRGGIAEGMDLHKPL